MSLCSSVSGYAWLLDFCAFPVQKGALPVTECLVLAVAMRGLLAQPLQDYALLTLSFAASRALNQNEGT